MTYWLFARYGEYWGVAYGLAWVFWQCPTNTQLDRRTNRTQLNHKTQQETVPQCTNLESKITNSKMPKKVPTQARKEFSDTYSVSTVIIETNIMIQQRRMRGGIQHCDTTEKDESIQ
jgi:hypothetical protein